MNTPQPQPQSQQPTPQRFGMQQEQEEEEEEENGWDNEDSEPFDFGGSPLVQNNDDGWGESLY